MSRWILTIGFVLGVSLLGATASAQGWGGGIGFSPQGTGYGSPHYGGIGYSAGYGSAISGTNIGLSVGRFNFNYAGQPQYYVQPRIYPQPHWDYHPTTVRRHGNHYHVIPGHYDLHVPGQRRHRH